MSATAETTTATSLPAGTWALDPAHSRVEFSVSYLGGAFRGTFSPFEAELTVSDAGEATLTGRTRVETIQVNDENLNAHLLSPDFFDAERAPEIAFASRELTVSGDRVTVDGDLSIRDSAKPLTLAGTVTTLRDAYGRERVTLDVASSLDRTAFGLEWNMPLPSGEPALSNDVHVSAQLYFVQA